MNIKKTFQAAALALPLTLGVAGTASAGIPVADGLHLAQTIAMSMAEQMMHEMLAEARDKLSEELAEKGFDLDKELADRAEEFAWDMYEQTTEKFGYGWNFDVGNSEIYKFLQVYMDVATGHINDAGLEDAMRKHADQITDAYREREGMKSEHAHVQKAMDKDLSNKLMQEEALAEISQRTKMIQNLRSRADNAKTPQEKEDLLIAINIEQAALQNEQMRLNTINNLAELENRTEMYRVSGEIEKQWQEIEFSY